GDRGPRDPEPPGRYDWGTGQDATTILGTPAWGPGFATERDRTLVAKCGSDARREVALPTRVRAGRCGELSRPSIGPDGGARRGGGAVRPRVPPRFEAGRRG